MHIRPGAWLALAVLAIVAICSPAPSQATDLHLSWNAVTVDNAGKPLPSGATVTYNVYGAQQGQPLKLVANVTTTTAVRSNVDVGSDCYAVTALVTPASIIQTQESLQTATICSSVAAPLPASPAVPTNLQIQQSPTPTSLLNPLGRRRIMFAALSVREPVDRRRLA